MEVSIALFSNKERLSSTATILKRLYLLFKRFADDSLPMHDGNELSYQVLDRNHSSIPTKDVRYGSDVSMPETTGVEFAREVLSLRPDMPIIMSTGFSHLVDADAARAAGMKAFLMKPLTKREIAKTVRQVLDG